MQLRSAALPFAALVVLSIAGCRQPGGAPDQAEALIAWCELRATNECDWRVKCGHPAGERLACIADLQSACAHDAALDAIREGRAEFVESRASECPANFYKADCSEYPSCPLPFEGTRGEADRCTHDVECANGAENLRCIGTGCERTCQRAPPPGSGVLGSVGLVIGRSCGDSFCSDGWCDERFENGERVHAACEPFLELGESCSHPASCNPKTSWCDYRPASRVCAPLPGEGDECDFVGKCQRGLFCDWSVTPRTCRVPRERGEPCSGSSECRLGLTCRRSAAGAEPVCEFLARAGEFCEGGECDRLSYCDQETARCQPVNPGPGERCAPFTLCQGDHWCQLGPDGKSGLCVAPVPEGSACGPYYERTEPQCERGLDCHPATNTCMQLSGEGGACDVGCASGLFCNPRTRTCSRVPGAGEPCEFFCGMGLSCIDKQCAAPPSLGDSCELTLSCGGTAVCDLQTLRCIPRREPGEPCSRDSDCRLGLCDEGACVASCR